MADETSRGVVLRHAGPVSTVTIERPARRNALDAEAMAALADDVETAAARAETRCLVLRGAGGAFCAGADLPDEIDGPRDVDHGVTLRYLERITGTMTSAAVPVVAFVDGPAAGVGASFAFASDIVLATRPSFFLLPFTGIGLVPDGGATLTVAASVGRARALRLALLQERIPADEALAMGLIARVCERDDGEAELDRIVQALVGGPARAIAETKRLVNAQALGTLDAALAGEAEVQVPLLDSWEHEEGVRAFRERRPADFSSRP